MAKTSKTPPNVNSERFVIKNLVTGLINKLNNILIVNDQTHRYVLEWKKGEGYLDNGYERTKNYYKLELYIAQADGDNISVYGDNHPIPNGMSELRVLEAELAAYKALMLHGLGTLISVQHSTFLQVEANQRNADLAEKKDVDSNLIL